ncbi:hypothetical protein Krac_4808 [Ktedonobacter racemifer DSM 44963]|uniref:Uncharacterized protein n=1 Tax=Ktedonobacter racemifer DSM 44963 TaxID=485913 RepID=D6TTR0_KTERA|nr:hypothetical protein Krac_4808 [Ktedonobacter racemifer DSM 44963]
MPTPVARRPRSLFSAWKFEAQESDSLPFIFAVCLAHLGAMLAWPYTTPETVGAMLA